MVHRSTWMSSNSKPNATINFGVIQSGQIAELSFPFAFFGIADEVIHSIDLSCDCVSVSVVAAKSPLSEKSSNQRFLRFRCAIDKSELNAFSLCVDGKILLQGGRAIPIEVLLDFPGCGVDVCEVATVVNSGKALEAF